MSSILTNTNAMAALQTLRTISSGMEETQSRISSGLRVGSAADNAAYWSIATTMKSDAAALSTVQDAMGLGAAKIDTAYAGMESAIEVVKEIKNKLVTAQESSADKTKIQEEIKQLQEQLKSIASSASFSGENFLQADITNAANNEIAKSVVGSFVRDASGNVKVQTVGYQLSASTVLFDTGAATGAAKGILDATLKLDEKRAAVEVTTNQPITATSEQLAAGGSTLGTAQIGAAGVTLDYYKTDGGDTYIRYNTEKFNADGSSAGFSPELDANGKELWVKVKWSATVPTDANNVAAKAVGATSTDIATTTAAPANTDLGVTLNTAGRFYIQTEPVVAKVSVAATTEAALSAALKQSATQPTLGANVDLATTPAVESRWDAGTASFTGLIETPETDGTNDVANAAAAAQNTADIAVITDKDFKKTTNIGGVMSVYSQFTLSDAATGTYTAGKVEQYVKLGADDTWVKVLDGGNGATATTDAGKAKAAGQQAITVGGNQYFIDSKNTTLPGKVETDAGVSVSNLDITKLGDLSKKLGVTENDALGKLVQYVDSQLSAMTSAGAQLGSLSSRIDMQQEFVSKLSDTLDKGIGRLVDADMNEESTRLKALQTQQQLAIQALSIANSDSQSILSLFR